MIPFIIGVCLLVGGSAIGIQLPDDPTPQSVTLVRVLLLLGVGFVIVGLGILVGESL
jgi:hypothetical protein